MSDQFSVEALRDLITKQQSRIDALEKRVVRAENQVEAAELYSRQDCLILRGKLDIRPNCSLRDEAMRLIQHHTGVQFPAWCLNTVHWLGKGDSLILRFNNKAVREAIYRNRIPKDVKKRGLFIHESLTSAKVQTVSKCAKLRREEKIVTYFTQSGHVYVKRTKESPNILVPDGLSEQQIIELIERQPTSYSDAAARRAQTTQILEGAVANPPSVPQATEQGTGQTKKLSEVGAATVPRTETPHATKSLGDVQTDVVEDESPAKETSNKNMQTVPKEPVTCAEHNETAATNSIEDVQSYVRVKTTSGGRTNRHDRCPASEESAECVEHNEADRKASDEKTGNTKSGKKKGNQASSASIREVTDNSESVDNQDRGTVSRKPRSKQQSSDEKEDKNDSDESSGGSPPTQRSIKKKPKQKPKKSRK